MPKRIKNHPAGPATSETSEALAEWQLDEIRAGLAEAERGEFASAEEVRRVIEKYRSDPAPKVGA